MATLIQKIVLVPLLLLTGLASESLADTGSKEFIKIYDLGRTESLGAVAKNGASGFVAVGYTNYKGAGDYDGWVVGMDAEGTIVWDKTFGGPKKDWLFEIAPAPEGGFIAVGQTRSTKTGTSDLWVVRLGETGAPLWDKKFGDQYQDCGKAVLALLDGGFLVAGCKGHGKDSQSGWLLKLSAGGDIIWERQYSIGNYDTITTMTKTSNNGFLIAGNTRSKEFGSSSVWWTHVDATGETLTTHKFGQHRSHLNRFSVLENGEIIGVGSAKFENSENYDVWLLKLDGDFQLEWQKTIDLGGRGNGNDISILPNGDFFLVGSIDKKNERKYDILLARTSPLGNVVWKNVLGTNDYESANRIQPLPDGGVLVVGWTVDGPKKNGFAFSYPPEKIAPSK